LPSAINAQAINLHFMYCCKLLKADAADVTAKWEREK